MDPTPAMTLNVRAIVPMSRLNSSSLEDPNDGKIVRKPLIGPDLTPMSQFIP